MPILLLLPTKSCNVCDESVRCARKATPVCKELLKIYNGTIKHLGRGSANYCIDPPKRL